MSENVHEQFLEKYRNAQASGDLVTAAEVMDDWNDLGTWEQLPGHEETLDEFRIAFEDGNHLALFYAVQYCANGRWLVPPWARRQLNRGLARYAGYVSRGLDDAFELNNEERRRGVRLEERRKVRHLKGDIYGYAISENAKGRSLTLKDIFGDAAEIYGVEAEAAQKYYYEVRQNLIENNFQVR